MVRLPLELVGLKAQPTLRPLVVVLMFRPQTEWEFQVAQSVDQVVVALVRVQQHDQHPPSQPLEEVLDIVFEMPRGCLAHTVEMPVG
jgi:hypothetical protein